MTTQHTLPDMNLTNCTRAKLEEYLALALTHPVQAEHVGTIMRELLARDVHDYQARGYRHEETAREIDRALEE